MTAYITFISIALLTGVTLIVGLPTMTGSIIGWSLVLVSVFGFLTLFDYKGKTMDDEKV